MTRIQSHSDRIEKIRTFALAFFTFSVLFSVTVVEGSLLLLIGVLIAEHYEAAGRSRALAFRTLRDKARNQPLFRAWMFYLAAGLLAEIFALNKGAAFSYLPSDLIKYVCFAVLLLTLEQAPLDTVAEFYTAGAVFTAALGTGQVAWFFGNYDTFYQRAGAFSNPVRYGEIMVIAFAFVLSALLLPPQSGRPGRRKYFLAAVVLIFVTILLTRTRGSYLGLAAVLTGMFAMAGGLRKRIASWIAVFLLIGALAAVLNPYLVGRIRHTYSGLRTAAGLTSQAAADTISNSDSTGINIRVELWKLAFRMFRDHPVTGVGPDNVKTSFKAYHPGPLGIQETWGSVHDLYLQQLAERGLVGLAALLTLFAGMFLLALKNYRAAHNAYTLWALTVLPAYFIMNITEVSFQHVHTSFAVFLALAASTNSIAS